MVFLDGAEHPESIPDHVAWTHAFLNIDLAQREGGQVVLASIGLSEQDLATANKAAAFIKKAYDESREKQRQMLDTMTQTVREKSDIAKALFGIEYGLRVTVLEESERLLNALSPDGRFAVEAWVNNCRKGITAFVPAAEVDAYQLPRD
jgi:hypothetical protein